MNQAISQRATPGAVLAVATSAGVVYQVPFGTLSYKQNIYETSVRNNTKYEIASLTKVIGTTVAIM